MNLLVDKIRPYPLVGNGFGATFKATKDACGHISRAVFVKAAKRIGLSDSAYKIAESFFVDGFRQVTIARREKKSRQLVHGVCTEALEAINLVLSEMEKKT